MQKFAQIFLKHKKFVQIFAQIKAKNNHAANVFAIFCANFCTLQFLFEKIAQKKAQNFYVSYMNIYAFSLSVSDRRTWWGISLIEIIFGGDIFQNRKEHEFHSCVFTA